MQVSVADAGPLRKQLTLSYSPEEVQARRSQLLRQLGGEVRLNGFRPGKSATAVVEKRYGSAATTKAEEQLLDEGVKKAIQEHHLRPIGRINSDEVARTEGLRLVLSFSVKPAITLPDPKSLGLTLAEPTIEDAKVEETLARLSRSAGHTAPLAEGEAIAEDDTITLDGTVTREDGTLVKELKGFQHLVGAVSLFGVPPEAVVAAVSGKRPGDTLHLAGTIPSTFPVEEHRGQAAKLALTITAANRLRPLPREELASRLHQDSPEALVTMVRTQLASQEQAQARAKLLDTMLTTLVDTVAVDIPPALLQDAQAEAVAQAAARAAQAQQATADVEKAQAEARANAEKSMKRFLIVDAIIESRRIGVTREDLEDQIRMAARQSGRPPQEIAKRLDESGQIQQVLQEIREAKALETFLDEALGKEPAPAANPAHGEAGHVHGPECAP